MTQLRQKCEGPIRQQIMRNCFDRMVLHYPEYGPDQQYTDKIKERISALLTGKISTLVEGLRYSIFSNKGNTHIGRRYYLIPSF